ncbi:MAG: protein translocase SEC61 complex subunit gamma [Candidatus Nanoarchaeia archaeon]|nr:protein translocase SEC61 complex subunit gamma [Candidatus Nanoarchaeia archaeon]
MNILTSLNSFFIKCKRVWQVLKKPTKDEFASSSKISAISILVLGVIGFIISLIVTALF